MHRYILQPYRGPKSRYRCPACNKPGTFVPYIDTRTGNHVHTSVGRCNREINCGYHFTPKQYFEKNKLTGYTQTPKTFSAESPLLALQHGDSAFRKATQPLREIDLISARVLNQSITGLPDNHFFTYLKQHFGFETALTLARRYYMGNSSHWPGATIFWQVDKDEHIRSGKIMLYSPDTGKRVKQPFNHITWVHSALKLTQYSLTQCLFGEHLLKDRTKTIALAESEKTAVIASAYVPQFTWLACGSLSNLTEDKLLSLKGRDIILFPDLNAFDKWSLKAAQLSHLANFTVSDLLEKDATGDERKQGLDLADYLVRLEVPVGSTQQPMVV